MVYLAHLILEYIVRICTAGHVNVIVFDTFSFVMVSVMALDTLSHAMVDDIVFDTLDYVMVVVMILDSASHVMIGVMVFDNMGYVMSVSWCLIPWVMSCQCHGV